MRVAVGRPFIGGPGARKGHLDLENYWGGGGGGESSKLVPFKSGPNKADVTPGWTTVALWGQFSGVTPKPKKLKS